MRLLLPAVVLFSFPLAAQQTSRPHPATPADHAASLPVTSVSLYKNGVGFFEHTGHVTGNADVSIDFTTAQLNDVLQSLTAIDLNGGRISGANYNSTTPLEQQLKSLPLALTADTTAADFYAAIRGARIEVHAPSGSITGRLLSVEDRSTTAKPGSDDATAAPTNSHFFLTIVADSGEVRTLELTGATTVRLLDAALHQDVTRYLELLAGNRSQGLRHLTLSDRGTGSRELRVSYISEVPIWKSTYRILFTDKSPGAPSSAAASSPAKVGTATLQGWAVVDNTVGEDWNSVQLSLIAGAPQSFIQPLSDPIYSRRPEIPIAQEAQLTPQTFDSSMDTNLNSSLIATDQVKELAMNTRNFAQMAQPQSSAGLGRPVRGYAGGVPSGVGASPMPVMVAPPPPPSYEELANTSLTTNTQTAAFDDFFQYKLTEPITIRKNESALVPILQAKIDAERVTLVSARGDGSQLSQPLRALWVTNTTGLTLDRGSFSIVENGSFGGEGLFDPIHANERRLLSYAADQAVHVTTEAVNNSTRVTSISAAKGVLILRRADVHEIVYVVHNAAAEHRTVVLEMPVAGGFVLNSTPKPTETTATVYRFTAEADAGETVRLHVGGKRDDATTYVISNSNDNELAYILNQTGHNAALEAALQPILEARRRVSDAQTAVNQTNARLTALRADEERQRANITALAATDKSGTARFVHDLNSTEDQITAAQTELAARTATLSAAQADLANRIENLQINETL